MKLQISFDSLDLDYNIERAQQVAEYADIIEVGTLPLFKHGTAIIEKFRETFPQKTLFADTKIIDRGRDVVSIMSQSGADWISVMAGTNKDVIHAVCSKAHDVNRKVFMDLLDASTPGQEALEAKTLGVDALLFHQPYDVQDMVSFLEQWEMIRGNTTLPIYVSASINRETIDQVIALQPDGIVIGSAIVESKDPQAEAAYFLEKIKNS